MSSEAAISVHGISKVYDLGLTGRSTSLAKIAKTRLRHPLRGSGSVKESYHALSDVSFDVAQGEVVGVIGKNGAGKSTLLKILSRITPPSRGYIDMLGTVGSLLEVGTGFHPELTGIENVYLNGTILGMSTKEIDRRLDEITDFAEVDQFLETPVKRYSSGMRVRLAFAVAAHLNPEVMIIDEVLSVGDYAFQAKCLDKMHSVASDEGRTVLYVTHNLVNLEHLCPRALLLVGGKLVYDGATADTLQEYMRTMPRGERSHTLGVFDLSVAARPAESPEQVFQRLRLRPNGGGPSDSVRMGERLQIELDVQGLDSFPDANVHITVASSTSQCVFRMTARMQPLRAAMGRDAQERIVIDIPELRLTPGEYEVHVGAHDKRGDLIDAVHRAAEFSVLAADVLGNGYQFTGKDGDFYANWDWEVRPRSEPAEAELELPGISSGPAASLVTKAGRP